MACCSIKCGAITGAVFGVLFAILGGILFPVGDKIIRDSVIKESIIENGTTAYDNWVSTGVPIYREFWLFEVKNPTEVVKLGAKPELVERGPYTYRTRYLPKEKITAYSNHTISFLLPSGAIFEPTMSVGTEEDVISTLDLAVAGAYSLVSEKNHGWVDLLIKLRNASLFQRKSVKSLLWGYHETMLNQTLGVFPFYNETFDGPYNVFTGKDDVAKTGIINTWQQEPKLDFWNDTYCDMINGTDAASFPPFLEKKPLYFFSSDICRSVSADFQRSLVLKDITLYRFTLNPQTLASPVENPDNLCFCRDPVTTRNCTAAGVLDVSACKGGRPVYISLPHFLHGSEFLTQEMIGLNPIEEEHMTYLDVEPITGITMRFAKRLQINMMYGPSQKIEVLKNVKNYTIFPLLWLEETATVDDETAKMFREEVTSRVEMLSTLRTALLSLGCVLFCLSLVVLVVHRCTNRSKYV
ncbi:hypothetical protein GJAV_G00269590 [Gymnothorax javanicus]|nr:hypothetical protein GJAV_G00269590 [Gymnothorax javanicus]